jgi:hypothetical protein
MCRSYRGCGLGMFHHCAPARRQSCGLAPRASQRKYRCASGCLLCFFRNRARTASGYSSPTRPPDSLRFETSDAKTLVATTIRLVDEALGLLENAKKADDRRTALAAWREARDGLALLMRVEGLLQPDGANTTIDNRKQVIQVLANLSEDEFRALVAGGARENGTPFPDAKALNL